MNSTDNSTPRIPVKISGAVGGVVAGLIVTGLALYGAETFLNLGAGARGFAKPAFISGAVAGGCCGVRWPRFWSLVVRALFYIGR